MSIRPSSSTGVIFALVSNTTIPLSISVLTQEPNDAVKQLYFTLLQHHTNTNIHLSDSYLAFFLFCTLAHIPLYNSLPQYLQVFLDNIPVAKLESLMLCYPDHLEVELHVSAHDLQISANTSTVSYIETEALRQALGKLNATMQQPVLTYIGGLPGMCFIPSLLD